MNLTTESPSKTWFYEWEKDHPALRSLKAQFYEGISHLRMDIIEFDHRTKEGRWGSGDIEWHRGRLVPNVLVTKGWFGDDWTIDRVDQQRRIFGLGEPPHFALHKTKWN